MVLAKGFVEFIFFAFGAVVGSFLNVCIHRLPLGRSVVRPPSHCPSCGKTIPWYDNVPLVSYLVLKARCRSCRAPIRGRYFVVEFLTACLSLALFLVFDLSVLTAVYAAFGFALIVVTFIDFQHRIIPDVISVPGAGLGLILSLLVRELHPEAVMWPWDSLVGPPWDRVLDSVSGLVFGAGLLWGLGVVWEMAFRKEAMGFGDVKLAAMMGAFLGWQLMLLAIFVSSVIGSIVGLILLAKTKDHYIPYGPYLALGALVAVFFGKRLIIMYLSFGSKLGAA